MNAASLSSGQSAPGAVAIAPLANGVDMAVAACPLPAAGAAHVSAGRTSSEEVQPHGSSALAPAQHTQQADTTADDDDDVEAQAHDISAVAGLMQQGPDNTATATATATAAAAAAADKQASSSQPAGEAAAVAAGPVAKPAAVAAETAGEATAAAAAA